MKNKAGRFFMVLGSLLILSSLALLIYNRQEAKIAGENAADALTQVQAAVKENEGSKKPEIKTKTPDTDGQSVGLPEEAPKVLLSEKIGRYGYIGYLLIPALGLELPIMDEWDYARLRVAPCRQFGDTADSLIIAGHNYARHFGPLHSLVGGEAVYFTDMEGNTTEYVVDTVEIVGPNGLDSLKDGEWNLVLYTCTYGGRSRVMTRCKKI